MANDMFNRRFSWNRDRGQIPNKDGFKLEVALRDGTTVTTKVVRDERGLHRLDSADNIDIGSVDAWRPV